MALVTPQELAAIKSGAQAIMAGAANAPGIAQTGAGISALYQKLAPNSLGGSSAPISQLYNQNRLAQQQAYNQAQAQHPDLTTGARDLETLNLGGLTANGLGAAVDMLPGAAVTGPTVDVAQAINQAKQLDAPSVSPSGIPPQMEIGPQTKLSDLPLRQRMDLSNDEWLKLAARDKAAGIVPSSKYEAPVNLPNTLYDLQPGDARNMTNREWMEVASRTPLSGKYESAGEKSPWGNLTLEQRAKLRQLIQDHLAPSQMKK